METQGTRVEPRQLKSELERIVVRGGPGMKDAFLTHLYNAMAPRIYNTYCRLMGDDGARDHTQDVFANLTRQRTFEKFVERTIVNEDGNPIAYLMTMARNHLRNEYRKKIRRPQTTSMDRNHIEGYHSNGANEGRDIESRLVRGENVREAVKIMLRLNPDFREPYVLAELEDLPYIEIAERLQLPEGTVKSRLHRARRELARMREERNGNPTYRAA